MLLSFTVALIKISYRGVDVRDWTKSWADGLAMCALVHYNAPSLIQFDSLRAENRLQNINTGLHAAKRLGVPQLLVRGYE